MQQKPAPRRRRHRLLKRRPITFSRFACALAASNKKVRLEISDAKSPIYNPLSSNGNGVTNPLSNGNGVKGKGKLSDSSDSEEFDGVVQADFVFFDPKPSDFHGAKILLNTYLDDNEWDLSGFVDLIVGQPTVGSVVKIEDDEDNGVYSIISALNLGRYSGSQCMVELKNYLLKVCKDKDVIFKLKSLLEEDAKNVGVLVSQRVVNLPPQLLPPLYDALFDEIEWAREDEPTEELRSSFYFKYYLIVSKLYEHKNAEKIRGSSKSEEEAAIYIKPEDEIFLNLSSWSFRFPLHAQQVTTNELKGYQSMGLVMAIEASKVGVFRQQLHSLIDET